MPTLDQVQSDARNVISFGPFRLRAAQRLLERAGTKVHLSARSLDTLIVLIERAGQVVSKALISKAWPHNLVKYGSPLPHPSRSPGGPRLFSLPYKV
jgi:DNA-binding winged helix-turn-helix (wHTH) protein